MLESSPLVDDNHVGNTIQYISCIADILPHTFRYNNELYLKSDTNHDKCNLDWKMYFHE